MDEKEVLNGYVIDVAMWIGHKRVCFGIAEDQKTEYPYMMCVYESEGYMFPVCDKLHCFDNYPEALHAFDSEILLISFTMSTVALVLSRVAVAELVMVGIFTPGKSAELRDLTYWGSYLKINCPILQ